MMTIGPGTPVIFDGAGGDAIELRPPGLTVGGMYFVERLIEPPDGLVCHRCGGKVGYVLRDRPGDFDVYEACYFHPLGGDAWRQKRTARVPA